ncbi:MAG: sialidase family protein, partial [Pirellulales bacterium]
MGIASKLAAQEDKDEDPKPAPTRWTDGDTLHLKGYDITLSAPVLVAEGDKTDILCMPTVTKLASGDLLVVMMNQTDVPHYPVTGVTSFSSDGGLNWTEPVAFEHFSGVNLQLPSGDELILPFLRAWMPDGDVSTPYNLIRKGERKLELKRGLEVTGFPEAHATLSAEGTLIGSFHFDGQVVKLKNGHYFATLYGYQKSGGIRIIGAESADGIHWKVVGTIAGRSGKVNERGEGPTEAALCRLKDGRLMCVYRVDNNIPYGQTWSSDEGRSWTEAIECRGPMSVEPNLAVLKDGAVLLAGGRPGAKLWLNQDGTGKDWQEVDMIKHRYKYQSESTKNGDTTGYNKIALLDDTHLLYVYDYGRTPPVARVEVV